MCLGALHRLRRAAPERCSYGPGCSRRPPRRRARAQRPAERCVCALQTAGASSRALQLPARLTLARAKLRRENDELRRALLSQLPDADDEAGDGAEQMLRAALSSEQRLRAETTAELAYLRTALWGTSGLAAASLVALAYSRLTRA